MIRRIDIWHYFRSILSRLVTSAAGHHQGTISAAAQFPEGYRCHPEKERTWLLQLIYFPGVDSCPARMEPTLLSSGHNTGEPSCSIPTMGLFLSILSAGYSCLVYETMRCDLIVFLFPAFLAAPTHLRRPSRARRRHRRTRRMWRDVLLHYYCRVENLNIGGTSWVGMIGCCYNT